MGSAAFGLFVFDGKFVLAFHYIPVAYFPVDLPIDCAHDAL